MVAFTNGMSGRILFEVANDGRVRGIAHDQVFAEMDWSHQWQAGQLTGCWFQLMVLLSDVATRKQVDTTLQGVVAGYNGAERNRGVSRFEGFQQQSLVLQKSAGYAQILTAWLNSSRRSGRAARRWRG